MNKKQICSAIVLFVGCIALVSFLGKHINGIRDINHGELYALFNSPDGRFKIEIYASKEDAIFPGQAGDVPGVVFLKDAKGNILNKKYIEMVHLVDDPVWSKDHVEQRLIFDWKLPLNTR